MSAFPEFRSAVKSIMPDRWVQFYAKFYLKARKRQLLRNCSTLTVSNEKRCPLFCVTLTSYGSRVTTTAPYCIASILNQDQLPDRLILWLAHGTELPPVYRYLKSCGLEIRFCEDIQSYKKLIPALEAFSDDVLITADDDVFYPNDWLVKCKEAYKKYPDRIQAFRCHAVMLNNQGGLKPYAQWSKDIECTSPYPERVIFPTGVNGILYPPHVLDERCTNRELFMRLAPQGDDIWFWAMGRIHGTRYAVIPHQQKYFDLVEPKEEGLFENVNKYGGNDRQIQNVVKAYPELLKLLVSEHMNND